MIAKLVRVGDVAEQVRGVSYDKQDASSTPRPGYLPILRAGNISDAGLLLDDLVYVPSARISSRQRVRKNDVLVAASSGSLDVVGKAARVLEDYGGGFGAFCKVLRPSACVDPAYFAHFFRTPSYRRRVSALAAGANINNLKNEHLDDMEIPLPPLAEQRRIAAILDQADAVRAKRRAAIETLERAPQAVYAVMFGDPLRDRDEWPTLALGEVCHPQSGGTPSKVNSELWNGNLPWFSPKDFKATDLFDSRDHVSDQVPTQTGIHLVPANTVAIVVRGMILAHTFPVCVLRVACVVNQDVKALLPKTEVEPQFLASCLRAQAGHALGLVSAAGHGTKRLDSEALDGLRVPLPPLSLQREFARRVRSVERLKGAHRASLAKLDELFASLQYRAFRGEL